MGRKSTFVNSWFTVIAFAIAVNFAFAKGVAAQKTDTVHIKTSKSKSQKHHYLKIICI
jgi:hypothetical protein